MAAMALRSVSGNASLERMAAAMCALSGSESGAGTIRVWYVRSPKGCA